MGGVPGRGSAECSRREQGRPRLGHQATGPEASGQKGGKQFASPEVTKGECEEACWAAMQLSEAPGLGVCHC